MILTGDLVHRAECLDSVGRITPTEAAGSRMVDMEQMLTKVGKGAPRC